jgi:fumarate reductase flavoprotein subunit
VFGARAGVESVAYARGASDGNEARLRGDAETESARIDALRGRKKGGEKMAQIRREMQLSMERGCGVYRNQDAMAQTVAEIAPLKGRYADLVLEDSSKVFNTEILQALELGNMLDVAEAIAVAAVARKESRGAHACRDFPKRNDAEYLHHSMVYFTPAGPRLDKKSVTITRFQPEERKY